MKLGETCILGVFDVSREVDVHVTMWLFNMFPLHAIRYGKPYFCTPKTWRVSSLIYRTGRKNTEKVMKRTKNKNAFLRWNDPVKKSMESWIQSWGRKRVCGRFVKEAGVSREWKSEGAGKVSESEMERLVWGWRREVGSWFLWEPCVGESIKLHWTELNCISNGTGGTKESHLSQFTCAELVCVCARCRMS